MAVTRDDAAKRAACFTMLMTCLLGYGDKNVLVRNCERGRHVRCRLKRDTGAQPSSRDGVSVGGCSRHKTLGFLSVGTGIAKVLVDCDSTDRAENETAVCGGAHASSVNYMTERKDRRRVAADARRPGCVPRKPGIPVRLPRMDACGGGAPVTVFSTPRWVAAGAATTRVER